MVEKAKREGSESVKTIELQAVILKKMLVTDAQYS